MCHFLCYFCKQNQTSEEKTNMNMKTTTTPWHWRMASLLLCMLMACTCMAGQGRLSGALKKECNRMYKQLKKDGWTVCDGKSTNLNEALTLYYTALGENYGHIEQLTATGEGSNLNIARSKARVRAASDYIRMIESEVESYIQTKVENGEIGADTADTKTQMMMNARSTAEMTINGLQPELTIMRNNGGRTEVQMLYLVRNLEAITSSK